MPIGSIIYDFSDSDGVTITNDPPMSLAIANNQLEGSQAGGGAGTNTAYAELELNGFVYKNNDYELYWRAEWVFASLITQLAGIEMTMDNGDVIRLYQDRNTGNGYIEEVGVGSSSAFIGNDNNIWVWLKVTSTVSASDRVFDMFYNKDDVTTKPSSFTDPSISYTYTGGKGRYITSYKFFFEEVSASSSGQVVDFDDIEIYSADEPYVDSIDGLIADYMLYEFNLAINAFNTGMLRLQDKNISGISTHLGNLLKTATITDAQGTVRFKGEIKRIRHQKNYVNYELTGYEQKLKSARCVTQTIDAILIVRSLVFQTLGSKGTYLYDNGLSLTTDQYAGYIGTFKKSNLQVVTLDPNHIFDYVQMHAGGSVTPDQTAGAIGNLYFNSPGLGQDNNRLSADKSDTVALELGYDIPALNTSTDITKMEIISVIACRRPSFTLFEAQLPEVFIFDFVDAEYNASNDLIYGVTRSDVQDSNSDDTFNYNQSEPITINQEIVINSNYFSAQIISGQGLYEIYRVNIAFESTKYATLSDAIHVIKALLRITYATEQDSEQSRFYINNNTATRIEFDASQTWETKCPRLDGYGIGDKVYISKTVQNLLTDIFTDSDITLTLSQNITGADQYGVTTEWKNRSLHDFVTWVKEEFNAIDYVDYANDTYYIVSIDNLTDTSLVLTRADILGYDDDVVSVLYDAYTIPGAIFIEGDNIEYEYSVANGDYTIEYTHTLGVETKFVRDKQIKTEAEALQRAQKIVADLKNAKKEFTLPINITNGPQLYSSLVLGSLVTIQLPTTASPTIADFSSGQQGKVAVVGYKHQKSDETGRQEMLNVTFRRMYS